LPPRSFDRHLTAAQRVQQWQLQCLGERFLDRPHRIEESLALRTRRSFECAHLGFRERVASYRQAVARAVLFQIDAELQSRVCSRERGVATTVTEAFARPLRLTSPRIPAQCPTDRNFLTALRSPQAVPSIPLRGREVSRIKVLGCVGAA
jgi:hypothetical protein